MPLAADWHHGSSRTRCRELKGTGVRPAPPTSRLRSGAVGSHRASKSRPRAGRPRDHAHHALSVHACLPGSPAHRSGLSHLTQSTQLLTAAQLTVMVI
jgi:hypothetical protein